MFFWSFNDLGSVDQDDFLHPLQTGQLSASPFSIRKKKLKKNVLISQLFYY